MIRGIRIGPEDTNRGEEPSRDNLRSDSRRCGVGAWMCCLALFGICGARPLLPEFNSRAQPSQMRVVLIFHHFRHGRTWAFSRLGSR
jgi:hypothetical protein